MQIELAEIYQEVSAELRAAELKAAELRGQMQMLERLIEQSQRPIMSGDPVGEPTNGRELHTGPLV